MRVLVVVAMLCGLASAAEAQTVVNPSTLSFTASADHATVIGGIAVLTNYEARYSDGATVVLVVNLNKPTPNASNTISVPLTSAGLPKNKPLTVAVFAIGPGGSSGSANSSPFAYLAAPAAVGNISVQ